MNTSPGFRLRMLANMGTGVVDQLRMPNIICQDMSLDIVPGGHSSLTADSSKKAR